MTDVIFTLAGQRIPPPVEWRDIKVISSFENDSVQASVDVDSFRFVNEAAQIIRDHIAAGNIFTGIPFTAELQNQSGLLQIINAYVNTSDGLIFNAPNDITAKIAKLDDLSDIASKIQGITMGLLLQKRVISSGNYKLVEYVVEKEFNAAELAVLSLSVYLMTKQIIDDSRDIATEVASLAAMITTGVGGAVSAIVLAAILLVIRITFSVLLIIALVKLIKELIEYIYPKTQKAYGMTFFDMLSAIFRHVGYSFASPIPELSYILLPSHPEGSTNSNNGTPNPQDYGYRATEITGLVKDMFNARFYVEGSTVNLRSLNDPFWRQQNSYVKPDVLNEKITYNSDQVVATRVISYQVDASDFYTVENFKGTAYELTTEIINAVGTPKELINVEGLEEIKFPVSLGNRKDGFSLLETILKDTIAAVGAVVSLFGGGGVKNTVQNRIGLLKIGQKNFSVPKIIIIENGRMPADYRNRISAKNLYNKYIIQKSLAENNFYEQAIVVEGEINPFTLNDQFAIQKNKYFTMPDGRDAEMTRIEWGFDQDSALLSYKVHEVYTRNIKESQIEPE